MYVLWCSCVGIWKWADLAFTCNQIRFDAAVFLSTSLGISSHRSIVSIGYSFVIFDFEFDPRFQSLVFSNNVILVCVWQNLFLWILPVFPTFFLLPSNIYVICWMRSSMVLPLFGKKKKDQHFLSRNMTLQKSYLMQVFDCTCRSRWLVG